jgi:putative transcriptional regulator
MRLSTTRLWAEDYSGSLLLAHPALGDKNFCRSVIGIARHKRSSGAFGIMLNRPLRLTLGDFDGEKWSGLENVPVYEGGPVGKDRLILSALEWRRGIFKWYLGLTHDGAMKMIRDNPSVSLQAFVGYAGWNNGQLEREVKTCSWVLAPIVPDFLINPTSRLWVDLLWRFHPMLALCGSIPAHPSMN